MSILIELSAGPATVPLDGVFDADPNARVAFEPLVRQQEYSISHIWVYHSDSAEIADAVEADEHVRAVNALDVFADRTLFEVRWTHELDGLFGALVEHDAAILSLSGTSAEWRFKLRFRDSSTVGAFQNDCRQRSVRLTIHEVHETTETTEGVDRLTRPQRELLTAALERGYFDIPRRTSLTELGDAFDISDQAASARLRRAQQKTGELLLTTTGAARP